LSVFLNGTGSGEDTFEQLMEISWFVHQCHCFGNRGESAMRTAHPSKKKDFVACNAEINWALCIATSAEQSQCLFCRLQFEVCSTCTSSELPMTLTLLPFYRPKIRISGDHDDKQQVSSRPFANGASRR